MDATREDEEVVLIDGEGKLPSGTGRPKICSVVIYEIERTNFC